MPSSRVDLPLAGRRALQACVGLTGLVLVFELLRLSDILPARSVPSTGAIAEALSTSLSDGKMASALGSTALAWALGLALAAMFGIPLGIAVGLSRWADSATWRTVEVLRPIPVVALIPVAIVVFGIALSMQVFLITLACVWPIFLGTRGGVRAVDPLQVDTARSFGLSQLAIVRRIVLPAAIPAIATALRVGATLGVIVAVGAQVVSGSPGLGDLLIDSQNAGQNGVVWACLVVSGLFGVVVNLLLGAAERRIAGWQELSTEARR